MAKRRAKKVKATAKKAAGKLEEDVGWATGDRRVEAEGHLRHKKVEQEGPEAHLEPKEVEAEEQQVRRLHGDLG
jgi:uncharacterized protein YjbJ (UPF0337 family)